MSRFVFFLPVLRQRQTTGQKYDDFVCDRLRSGDFVFTAGTVFSHAAQTMPDLRLNRNGGKVCEKNRK